MKITKYTMAVDNIPEMVNFYNTVFDAGIEPIGDTPFHAGTLAGIELLFCPNTITEIEAEKNRIQWQITVDDIEAIVEKAKNAGGDAYGERGETDEFIGWAVVDPDNNSIELLQLK